MTPRQAPAIDLSLVTYQSERWLPAFFASLVAQSFPLTRIRLLLRDNGSSDRSIELCRQFAADFGDRLLGVEIEAGQNIGFGRGHNANLAKAQHELFLVSNVDVEFLADTLTTLVDAAVEDPPEVVAWECRQLPYEHPKSYHPASLETDWVACACVLFGTAALREVGGFEPRLFMYGEDVELSYRLRDHGYRLRYLPRAAVIHHAYATPGEIKPTQLVGNHLANALLRLRFGSLRQMTAAPLLLVGRLLLPQRFAGQRAALAGNLWRFLRLAPAFLSTRKRSGLRFGFSGWDYGSPRRRGAFHRSIGVAEGPKVSLLIRTFAGRGGKLAEAMQSVANQTYGHIELVVVEDGGDSLRQQVAEFAVRHPRLEVVYAALPKGGRCASGNHALALATGEYCGFLDDDDLLFADHIEVLASELTHNREWEAAYACAFEVRTRVLTHEPWRYEAVATTPVFEPVFSRERLYERNFLPIQTVLFRKRLFDRLGGFDPELDNLEDWNLWLRYALVGDFGAVAKTTSLFRVPASSHEAHRRRVVMVRDYAEPARRKNFAAWRDHPDLIGNLPPPGNTIGLLRRLSIAIPGIGRFYYPCRNLLAAIRRRF